MANLAASRNQKEYHQFYTPPPVRSKVLRNATNPRSRNTSPVATERRTSVILLNKKKLHVARLMTFSRLQQAKLKTRLKILRFLEELSVRRQVKVSQSMDAGLGDVVTASGLENPDHLGWLVDQTVSQRRWCVVADMLFCVFENDCVESPLQVFVLPGYEVKHLVYNSAKRTALSEEDKGAGRTALDTLTVSGMLRYQFVLKDKVTAKTHAFGMDNKTDLDIWMSVLRNAVQLDVNLFGDSDSECDLDEASSYQSSQNSVLGLQRSSSTIESSPSERSSQTGSIGKHRLDKRELLGTSLNTSRETINQQKQVDSQSSASEKLLNRANNNTEKPDLTSRSCDSFDVLNYVPSHRLSERRKVGLATRNHVENSESVQKVRAFTKVVRSSSCKDVLQREHSVDSDNLTDGNNNGQSLKKLRSIDDFRKKLRKQSKSGNDKSKKIHKMHSSNNLEISSDFKLLDDSGKPRTWSGPKLGDSAANEGDSTGKERGNMGHQSAPERTTKVKKSNSLKEFFTSGKSSSDEGGSNKAASLNTNTDMEGYLYQKQLLKWTRVWCKVCDKHLFGFKSQESSGSSPELSLYLPDCSLALVSSDKGRRIYTFKVCQPGIRSTYLSADKLDDYCQWLDILKKATNTMDLFRRRSSLEGSEISKSEDTSGAAVGFRRQLRREISGPSAVSSDTLSSNGNSKSTSSLTSYLKNHMKSLKSSKTSKTELTNGKLGFSNLSSGDLHTFNGGKPTTEKIKQRLKDQRKYSMPNLSYTTIMEQAKEANLQSKTVSSQRQVSTSASSGKLHSHYSAKTSSKLMTQESLDEGEEPSETSTKVSMEDTNLRRSPKQVVTQTNKTGSNGEVQTKLVNGLKTVPHPKCENEEPDKAENDDIKRNSMASIPAGDDGSNIFNTHLPGPNNEGLLLVRDDITDHQKQKKPILGHRRVNSDGRVCLSDLEPDKPAKEPSTCPGEVPDSRREPGEHRAPVCVGVAARELHDPRLQGYLDTLMEEDWVNIWGVLKEDALYVYSSPIDEQTLDVLDVREWEVSTAEKMSSRDQVLAFTHPKFEPQYLSSESSSEMDQWREELQKLSRRDLVYEKDADRSTAGETEEYPKMEAEDLDSQKSELLKYLLSQRKQAMKSIQGRRSLTHDSSSQDTDLSSEANDKRDHSDFIMVDDDQNWKDMTQLMQRKVSMQLKVDNIQKHLVQRQGRKVKVSQPKKKFKLPLSFSKTVGKSSVSGESAEDRVQAVLRSPEQQQHLKLQVEDLNTKIDIIKQDIEDKKLQMRAPGSYHEIHEPLLLSHEKPVKDKSSPEEKTLFSKSKLGRKFTVPKIKTSSSTTSEVKLREKVKDGRVSEEMSLRHSWSPESWRGVDSSPTSPPDYRLSSLYHHKRARPPHTDFSPLQEEDDLNITASSGNISQDTGYCSPTAQRRLNNTGYCSPTTQRKLNANMDTPMRDMVHRNNNSYISTADTSQLSSQHCNLCTSMDEMDSSKLSQISDHTISHIKDFEDFIKTKLQLQE